MKTLKNQKGFGLVEGLLIVIALTLVVGVGYYVYNANKQDPEVSSSSIYQDDDQGDSADEQSSVVNEEASEAAPLPKLVSYGDEGVRIKKPEDVSKLKNASESFKSFIADEITAIHKKDTCIFIQVSSIYKDAFALGAEGSDGGGGCYGYGARSVWIKTNNEWSYIEKLAGHETPLCSVVEKYSVPKQIIPECMDENNDYKIVKNQN